MMETWDRLAPQARMGIAAGLLLILGLAAGLGYWAYRPDYQVLFTDMAPADAATMTAELDKLKTPYQLADGGNTILVPKDLVYRMRLKLMGKELPLHGAVGFEVFNNTDFGTTEFVQKVNYQRAIQGELTRTILSIEEVQAARVHLAIPEQGLFKKAVTRSKASVTLTMKSGKVLAPEQIAGIQRLIAASVPDIVSADVTVLNQHGVALTRVESVDGGVENAASQLDSKRGTEDYLLKKVNQVLERTYGEGEAVASVDVQLNLDQSKTTTEEVLPAKGLPADASPAGVMVRDRQSSSDGNAGTALVTGAARSSGVAGSTTSESDYQVGRRVEQVVAASGGIHRMTVAVLVKRAMTQDQRDKLKEVVGLALGISSQRGDAVVVYSMEQLATPGLATGIKAADAAEVPVTVAPAAAKAPARPWPPGLAWGALACAVGVTLLWLLVRRKSAPKRLSVAEREAMLSNIRLWINAPADGVQGVER
jgi:flagellar M-ring protein FliF